ncbi:MAG: hypothetical protein ACLFSM_02385 [Thermoplasmata archaeon]
MTDIRARNIDEEGALEGLPLYMIILVVIAGIGTAILAGWMMNAQSTELGSLEVEDHNGDEINKLDLSEFDTKTIYVRTYDQQGDSLKGVTVSIEGCGAGDIDEPVKVTDEDGEVSFELNSNDLRVTDGDYDTIDITAEYEGDMDLTESATITVKE